MNINKIILLSVFFILGNVRAENVSSINVVFINDFKPYYYEENGKTIGKCIQPILHIFNEIGINVDIKKYQVYEQYLDDLEKGSTSVLLTHIDDHHNSLNLDKDVLLTQIPYHVVKRKGFNIDLNANFLKNYRIGVDKLLYKINDELQDHKLDIQLDSTEKLVKGLIVGYYDLIIENPERIFFYLNIYQIMETAVVIEKEFYKTGIYLYINKNDSQHYDLMRKLKTKIKSINTDALCKI